MLYDWGRLEHEPAKNMLTSTVWTVARYILFLSLLSSSLTILVSGKDVNGDGLIDIIWQVSVGPTFSYLTLINNSTTKRFDATSCASSDPTWCTHFEPTPEYLIKTVRAMSRERIIIRLFNDSESAVEIARPYSLDDLLDSAAKYLAINGPCRIFRVGSGARITSVAHVLSGESIEFRCF